MEQFDMFAKPEPKPTGETQEPINKTLKERVKEEKKRRAEEEQKKIDDILGKKDKILASILKGIHYRPDDSDDEQTWWLCGRGGKGVKTEKGNRVKVAFVGLYPSTKEITHRPSPSVMVGPSGKYLDQILRYCIENPDEVYRTNLIKYYKKPKSKLTATEKKIGREILTEELKAKGIEYVICLGSEVYDALCNDSSRYSASRFRGTFLPPNKCRVNAHISGLQNPAYIISPEGEKETQNFEENLTNLFKFIKSGHQTSIKIDYEIISDLDDVKKWEEEIIQYKKEQKLLGNQVIGSLDTEVTTEQVGGTMTPTDLIIMSTSYGNQHAEKPEDIKTHVWVFQKTPEWESFDPKMMVEDDSELDLIEKPEPEENEEEETGLRQEILNIVFNGKNDVETAKAQKETERGLRYNKIVNRLDTHRILKTDLYTKLGRKVIASTLVHIINHELDELVLQHGHFDKQACELLGMDWVENINGHVSELMIETLMLNENDIRGLKDVCSKTLGWQNYDTPLELVKAQLDINNYLHIPSENLIPYAALDAAGTLLARIKKEKQRKTKWLSHGKIVKKYYDGVEALTGHKHSDPEKQNPESMGAELNALMTPLYRVKKRGMPVGPEGMKKVRALIDYYQTHYEKLRQEVNQRAMSVLGMEFQNPGSQDQVSFVLYGPREKGGLGLEPLKEPGKNGRMWHRLTATERAEIKGKGAIDGESLGYLVKNLPAGETKDFVKRLWDTRQIKSIMDNFFSDPADADKGFFSRISPDERLHTEYMPTTETLRFRSTPNLANPPKKESKWVAEITGEKPPCDLRNSITAFPGHLLLVRDWSSAEVFLLMLRSNDEAGLDVINRGLDFHLKLGLNSSKHIKEMMDMWQRKDPILAEIIKKECFEDADPKDGSAFKKAEERCKELMALYNSTDEKKSYKLLKVICESDRDKIKPVTFGVPYGQTKDALSRLNNMTEEEAEIYIGGYHSTYKNASAYLKYNGQFAVNYKLLPNPWGYLRNFSSRQSDGEVERQAFNLPLQHGVACMMNAALNDWEIQKKKYNLKSEVFLSFYDAIGWHVPEAEARTVAEISHEIMTTKRPVGPLDNRTIPTEGKFMHNWEGDKIKGYSWNELNLV